MSEDAIAHEIAVSLGGKNWVVAEERGEQGVAGPDLVVEDPAGRSYLIEVKSGQGATHFSQIAQVESMAASRLQQGDAAQQVQPVLVTTMAVSERIGAMAETVGVEIVKAHGSPEEIGVAVARQLSQSAE
ncbi:hypothetical protein [Amycolatopsis sp. TNS106]|uniref:hypothetical protein n=1 Tax=Amycolatopsis sp. TNS106 TaxID=2861750 RepID=UPI001C5780D7|nr:hypothetical protein [Amycolatopsis sp. TNS106]QXV56068.1 hypothetical protein CVV72_02880 [Amycolatopsis sp. TNS106]